MIETLTRIFQQDVKASFNSQRKRRTQNDFLVDSLLIFFFVNDVIKQLILCSLKRAQHISIFSTSFCDVIHAALWRCPLMLISFNFYGAFNFVIRLSAKIQRDEPTKQKREKENQVTHQKYTEMLRIKNQRWWKAVDR